MGAGSALSVGEPPAAAGFDHLSRRDFQRLADFIHAYSGIKMPSTKVTMVEGRLRRRIRATGTANFAEYCRHLFEDGGLEREAVHLIDAVTTNKTDFFREPDHFRFLVETAFPEMVAERRISSREPVKLWSAACSTGAEPYTLAMVLDDFGRSVPGFHATILATDICSEVLQTAILGIYPQAMAAPVPPDLRQRYFMRAKRAPRDRVRVVPEMRAQIRFGRLNLMEQEYPVDKDLDVIFCRNILIYFDKPTQEAVLGRLCDHLRPGGYLILGHSESLAGLKMPLRPVGVTVFRRV